MDLRTRWASAPDFAAYLEAVEAHVDLWHALYRRARVPRDLLARAWELRGPWHFLALSEDWCGDAVNALPFVARWAEALPGAELRVLGREDNPDLMDTHLTDGGSRSIPVVMVLDPDFREVGWWGPRPGPLQRWVLEEGREMDSRTRYREIRRWYARDGGRTILEELLGLMVPTPAGRS